MKNKGVFVFSFMLFCLISLCIYAFYIEPKRITVQNYDLTRNNQQKPIKLVQLSDIHLQANYPVKHLRKIITKINHEQPDIVVFTGDLFDNFAQYGPIDETIALLKALEAPLGKFAIWGNHDYGGGAAHIYSTILQEADFQLLENTGTTLSLPTGHALYMAGLDDALLGQPSISDALAEREKSDYTILLSHEPDVADYAIGQEIDLILSGHSHGGQVKLPFVSVTNALSEKYTANFYQLDRTTTLFVNTGLGTTKIPVRFGVPPTFTVFNLYLP